MTVDCMRRLGLKMQPSENPLDSLGGSTIGLGTLICKIYGRENEVDHWWVQFIIVNEITAALPMNPLVIEDLDSSVRDHLADLTFATPGKIEALVGAGVWGRVIMSSVKELNNGLIAQKTRLGWVVFGESADESSLCCHMRQASNSDEALDQALQRLWESDKVDRNLNEMSPDELWCEQNFNETHYRDITGRYVVQYCIKPDAQKLGDSYKQARERFLALERRFKREPELRKKYCEFMAELVEMGHIRIADELNRNEMYYYIPHHAVLAKFRVVFDASMKTTSGYSLNDIQLPGPKKQPDLYDLTMKFRMGSVAASADIKKMYRQIALDPRHQQLQRIFWRAGPDEELKEYQICRVIYGVASAGYVAVKALNKCAEDNASEYPLDAKHRYGS